MCAEHCTLAGSAVQGIVRTKLAQRGWPKQARSHTIRRRTNPVFAVCGLGNGHKQESFDEEGASRAATLQLVRADAYALAIPA